MEASPLTQQARPTSFQPKIAQLYEDLFKQDDEDLADSDGFWSEFFLLNPDKGRLRDRLEGLHANDLLHLQHETQQLFLRAISQIKEAKSPMDENAMDTLTVFLGVILTKRYTNPSADIITVVAGLDEVDSVFFDFANTVEATIRSGRSVKVQQKAIDVTLSLISGAYQTSLVSYFTHRDLFPSLMKYIKESETSDLAFRPFLLLGLLANYDKFEFRNPYRIRLEDFVNENTIQRIVRGLGTALAQSRNHYVAIQEDIAEGWSLTSALTYIGLGILAPSRVPTLASKPDELKGDFADLPDQSVAILLAAYDFTAANKVFCYNLITCPAETKDTESPFSAFLSLTSYLLHHAHRSLRATLYGLLNLLILRIIIEDLSICKTLCTDDSLLQVRLCRQRQPFLPPAPKPRPPIAAILDILLDTINHNLRRHLDLTLYIPTIGLLHRILSYLSFTRTRLEYHWSLLWQTLLSFLRFLTTYAPSLPQHDPSLPHLLHPFLATLALAVTAGESFLPSAAAYDDLFYKLVEAGSVLARFKTAFATPLSLPFPPKNAANNPNPNPATDTAPQTITSQLDLLIRVSNHYHTLVETEREKGRLGNNPSPKEVSKIIRQGNESLDLPGVDGLDRWDRFREGDERAVLKRVARGAVEDVRALVARG